jgi:hypothetical protein
VAALRVRRRQKSLTQKLKKKLAKLLADQTCPACVALLVGICRVHQGLPDSLPTQFLKNDHSGLPGTKTDPDEHPGGCPALAGGDAAIVELLHERVDGFAGFLPGEALRFAVVFWPAAWVAALAWLPLGRFTAWHLWRAPWFYSKKPASGFRRHPCRQIPISSLPFFAQGKQSYPGGPLWINPRCEHAHPAAL